MLASDNGQTDKAHSTSVVEASDSPLVVALASLDTKFANWSVAFTTALAAKLIVKASAGRLRSASGRLDSTAPTGTYYVQLWDAADVPVDPTAVGSGNALMAPYKISHVIGFDDTFSVDFGEMGKSAVTGIVFGLSSTEFTKTASGAYLSVTAEYT